ncbi:MAG TPA: hypothetical protein VE860_24410, partial [Chthoniobacterales bacterium]|nr:hypothetical protein [Chthoniobacterales bacterium]
MYRRNYFFLVLNLCIFFLYPAVARSQDQISPSVTQLIVGIAADWDSMHGQLQRFDRTSAGWRATGPPIPVLFGKSGLAWGRGLIRAPEDAPVKTEHDHRAPAGVFRIGLIYTYDQSLPAGA